MKFVDDDDDDDDYMAHMNEFYHYQLCVYRNNHVANASIAHPCALVDLAFYPPWLCTTSVSCRNEYY